MGSGNQTVVRPPQRGIFPLDHFGECRAAMQEYLDCLQASDDAHYKCRELSKAYLSCRMERQLMAKEKLEDLGYREDAQVVNPVEYDKSKEKAGYVAGKHIAKQSKWWWQSDPNKKPFELSSNNNNASNDKDT